MSECSLTAGVARVDITPPLGFRMQGIVRRTAGAVGVETPLSATVLVLADAETKIAEIKKSKDTLNTKTGAVDALIAAKKEDPKVAAAQAALEKDKENKDLQKKLANAKAAQKKAVDNSNAKIKALAGDKEFSAVLKTLQAASTEEVEKKKVEISAPLAEFDKQAKAAEETKTKPQQ